MMDVKEIPGFVPDNESLCSRKGGGIVVVNGENGEDKGLEEDEEDIGFFWRGLIVE